MNCDQLLYSYFENDAAMADVNSSGVSTDVAAHIRVCEECRNFVDAQRELGARLRLLRDSAPQISSSVDSAVLVNYRRRLDRPMASIGSTVSHKPASRFTTIVSRGGIAAAIVVTLLLAGKRKPTPVMHDGVPQVAALRQPGSVNNKLTANGVTTRALGRQSPTHPRRHRETGGQVMSNSLPSGFQSLMYCDPLSCGGTMDVIRMQLPASPAGSTPRSGAGNGRVLADVLVGADGIARAIRIVE
jgi:hypothetical protein